MKEGKKTNLQIRGMPVPLRDEVSRRAAKKGQTMSQYLTELIERRIKEEESLEKWLDEVRRWEPIPVAPGTDVAQAIREAREERAEHLAQIFSETDRRRSQGA
jgi:predicted DNA-binding protein